MDNYKQAVIDVLESIVDEDRVKAGEEIASKIEELTGVYPEGWTPSPRGINWLGYNFYFAYDMFSMGYTLRARVDASYTKRTWYGKRVAVKDFKMQSAGSPADLLRVLKEFKPYDG